RFLSSPTQSECNIITTKQLIVYITPIALALPIAFPYQSNVTFGVLPTQAHIEHSLSSAFNSQLANSKTTLTKFIDVSCSFEIFYKKTYIENTFHEWCNN